MENEMVKSYYANLTSAELIQITTSDFDQLTSEAKEIVNSELDKRRVSFDEIIFSMEGRKLAKFTN
jgi:hypothetical protein